MAHKMAKLVVSCIPLLTSVIIALTPELASAQSFKGHHIAETVSEFFSTEPALQAKVNGCRADTPYELTPDEIRHKYGEKVLKDYEKRRAKEPAGSATHIGIMSDDADGYGDRCGALLDLANSGSGTIGGDGYRQNNKFHDAIEQRELIASPGTSSYTATLKERTKTLEWRGSDPEHRFFQFRDGHLSIMQTSVYADYAVVVGDITKKLGTEPTEVLTPMHNVYGATWNDAESTWNTPALHVAVSVRRNPADPEAPS